MLVLERNGELYNKRSNSFMNVREREYNSFSSIEEIKKLGVSGTIMEYEILYLNEKKNMYSIIPMKSICRI